MVKDLDLSLLWLRLDPQSRKFHMLQCAAKKERKTERQRQKERQKEKLYSTKRKTLFYKLPKLWLK